MKVRSLDRSVRNGALIAGIPLAISGAIPWSVDPLVFVWTVASESGEITPLLPAAAGIMLLAVALIPGLPRMLRGLLLLAFTAAPIYLLIDPIDAAISGQLSDLPGGGPSLGSTPFIFLGAIAAAATLELIGQGLKASRLGAILALIGWLGFSLQYVLPIYGPKPLVVLLAEGLGNMFGAPMGVLTILASAMMVIAALYLLLGVFGCLFALKRLLSSVDRRLAGGFKSGWAGVLMGAAPAIIAAAPIVIVLGEKLELPGVLVGSSAVLMLWGFGTGVTGGLAHTALGFIPTPKPSTGDQMARPVYQPQEQVQPQREVRPPTLPPHQPQPAQTNDLAAIEAAQAAIRQQQEMEAAQQRAAEASQQQMQAQQYQQQQQQPAAPLQQSQQAGGPLPQGSTLQAYPGYPGYVVCPACGGGVAVNAASCTHCSQPIAWA